MVQNQGNFRTQRCPSGDVNSPGSPLRPQKLHFTQSEGATPRSTLLTEEWSQQLDRLLLEDMATDEQVFDWVEVRTRAHSLTHSLTHSMHTMRVEK